MNTTTTRSICYHQIPTILPQQDLTGAIQMKHNQNQLFEDDKSPYKRERINPYLKTKGKKAVEENKIVQDPENKNRSNKENAK